MRQEYQDQIDDYLLGRMSDEDRMSFEKELKQDAELREQMEFTQNVQTATKSRNEKLAKMDEWEDDYVFEDDKRVASANYRPTGSGYESCHMPSENRTFAKPHSSRKGYLYWISGVAAIFIAGFFLFNTFYGDEEELQYSPMKMGNGAVRAGSGYAEIEQLLVNKDYQQAFMLIEQEEKAISEQRMQIDSIVDDEKRAYDKMLIQAKADELSLLKVYALIGIDRREEALLLLDELRNKESDYKGQADSLYQILTR